MSEKRLATGDWRLATGVSEEDSTFLACSYEAVLERLKNRGLHDCAIFNGMDGDKIARAAHMAIYGASDGKKHLIKSTFLPTK